MGGAVNPRRLILATEAGALTLAVYGDLSSRDGAKLPAPRAVIAILFLYGVLGWVAEFGRTAGRFAAASGGVLFLTMLVGTGAAKTGQEGAALVQLLRTFTSKITGGPAAAASSSSSSTASGPASSSSSSTRSRGGGSAWRAVEHVGVDVLTNVIPGLP